MSGDSRERRLFHALVHSKDTVPDCAAWALRSPQSGAGVTLQAVSVC